MVQLLVSSYAMIVLAATSRLSSAFVPPIKTFRRALTSVAASDNDFDDFTSKVAFMFPGQGAQSVGMCSEVVNDVALFPLREDRENSFWHNKLLNSTLKSPQR